MHEGQLIERQPTERVQKLRIENPLERALMVVIRTRSAWNFDSTTVEGYARLVKLREEVNYLTAKPIAAPAGLMSTEFDLSAFPYDETNVIHRVSHPDRPDDDLASFDPELVTEITLLLNKSPDAIKQFASRDDLLGDQ